MTPEMIYNALIGLIIAAFWYWVKAIDSRRTKADDKINEIEHQMFREIRAIHENYLRREDGHRENQRVYDLLTDIKRQINRLSDKLDKKADK